MNNDILMTNEADAVFIVSKVSMNWINTFGIIIVVLMLIPNCIYAIKNKDQKNLCQNKIMNIIEQIGRYGCMVLMIFDVGLGEFGFPSVENFLIYMFGNVILIISYWIVWIMYFRSVSRWKQITLAILPTAIFLLSGITMQNYLLAVFGIIFGIGHIYVTYKNM